MKNLKNILKSVVALALVMVLVITTCVVYATESKPKGNNVVNHKVSVLDKCQKEKVDINSTIETEMIIDKSVLMPKISDNSERLLEVFEKDIKNVEEVKQIYDSVLDREVTRVISEDAEIDFDSNGELVAYKNLDDFSTIDKDKKDYNKDEELPEIQYQIKNVSQLSDTIKILESENDLSGYKLVDCSNNIESAWVLTWCKDYGNGLVNPYDCANAVIDAKDGSIMLFGKNKMEPDSTVALITEGEALKLAQPIISEFENEKVDVNLTFFRPNFYWDEGGPYEIADFVRLSWEVSIKDCVSVHIDAETGEILGGGTTQGDCARSMFVVDFVGQEECAMLAYNAFNRLGFNQTNYSPVYWSVTQTDMDWIVSRTDMFGLYLSCHGSVAPSGRFSILTDERNWTLRSDTSYGDWHFVYLDACFSSSNNNFVNAFDANDAGECFVGWNVAVNVYTALDFNRRFFPRLGTMSVYDAVITSLWESRNAGYNTSDNICDPGFIGDLYYYGWAW